MSLEEDLIARGTWPLCGIDEAGRGPLAGPVVAAAVIMDPASPLRGLVRDSKQLSGPRREKIFLELVSSAEVHYGVSVLDAAAIDEMNILQATLQAMSEAVRQLSVAPSAALVDGNALPRIPWRTTSLKSCNPPSWKAISP